MRGQVRSADVRRNCKSLTRPWLREGISLPVPRRDRHSPVRPAKSAPLCGRARRAHPRRSALRTGGLRLRFPRAGDVACEAVMVNTAGGIVGGDVRADLGRARARMSL